MKITVEWKETLKDFCRANCVYVEVEELLRRKIKVGGVVTTIAKIVRKENFTVEETIAFCAGIEKFDTDDVITAIKNNDYDFHADVGEYSDLGNVLRKRFIEDGIIPKWLFQYIDIEHMGRVHVMNVNCVIFEVFGYFELF